MAFVIAVAIALVAFLVTTLSAGAADAAGAAWRERAFEDSDSSDDEGLMIWDHDDYAWDEVPESALRAGKHLSGLGGLGGATLSSATRERAAEARKLSDMRDAYMARLERIGASRRDELADRRKLYGRLRRAEEAKEARTRRDAGTSREAAMYLRTPLEDRDLTYAMRATRRAEEDEAVRAYHARVLGALDALALR